MKSKPYLIAEIGFNHEGDLEVAERMIREAADSGANAVKFQTFRGSDIALPNSPHFAMIEAASMTLDQHLQLSEIAKHCSLAFLSTPFSEWGVDMLEQVGVSAYKVASMDLTNKPLLSLIAKTQKPVYLSTGMGTIAEIADALEHLAKAGTDSITLLHCVSEYPAKAKDLNLAAIPYLQQTFGVSVGYSDHYPGIDACLMAAILGAEVIETHFTLDNTRPDGDHAHSATPAQLKWLKDKIELLSEMVGSGRSSDARPDRSAAKAFRRGVHAARNLKVGEKIGTENLLVCRPQSEFGPNDVKSLIGRTLRHDVNEYAALTSEDLL
jgi:N,N'-diacetyllegionaminate synthase